MDGVLLAADNISSIFRPIHTFTKSMPDLVRFRSESGDGAIAPQSMCRTTATVTAVITSTVLITASVAASDLLRVVKDIATKNASMLEDTGQSLVL